MTEQGATPFGVALQRLAEADPERPAVTCAEQTISRAELVARAQRVAGRFAELGVAHGSLVTIGLPNSIEFIDAMFATWLLGATPQPVSHRLPPAERRAIVELASPALAVGVPSEDAPGCRTLSAEELRAAAQDPTAASASLEPGLAPFWKIVTSGGSTGRPKLIVARQPAAAEAVAPFADLLYFPRDGCVLVTGPLSHNAPFVVATVGLLSGNHVVVMPRFDAAETLRLADAHRVQWLYLVPTMMLRIWRLTDDDRLGPDLSALQIAFHMAAPCPAWLKQAWIDWLGPERILELYGGTELQALTVITGSEWLAHRGSVGRAVLGEIEVRDSEGRPLPSGEIGELWMRRGPDAPPPYHYIGASARTAEDGWESLGDIGFLDDDGYVYITDRESDMILVGGANVYPAEIEAVLDAHPAVRSSCVIGLPSEDLGAVPHAIVELAEPVTDEELLAHLADSLAPYKVPRTIERVQEPLRDEAGKVRRSALRAERIAPALRGSEQ